MTLLLLVLQVTLWLFLGVALYLGSLRQGPRAAARCLSLILGGVALLSAAALLPLPGWPLEEGLAQFQRQEPPKTAVLPEPTIRLENPPPVVDHAEAASPFRFSLDSLLQRRGSSSLAPTEPTTPAQSFPWETVGLTVLLACGAFGLVRLLLGLWAVRECRRRSVVIHSDELRQLCDTLRSEMSIAQQIELRSMAGLGSPATVGWRQPMLLLPANWRTWSDEERRSVLAHELAHVQAGDYLRWLLAQLAAALHGYQPLVHWLLARLHREQELAADQTAARHAGGTAVYLRSLCQLALTQEEGTTPFPARTFLSVRFSLIRRITMLRSWKNEGTRTPSGLRHWCGLALLLTLGVGVAGLRSTSWGQEKAQDQANGFPPPSPSMEEKDRKSLYAPFVLNYLRPDAMGAMAVRPALGMKEGKVPSDHPANHVMRDFFKVVTGKDGPYLYTAMIEQMVFGIHITPKTADKQGTLQCSLNLIRFCERCGAWPSLLGARFPKLEKVQHGKGSYYRVPADLLPIFTSLVQVEKVCLFLPDERTLVLGDERQVRQWLTEGEPKLPAFVWAESWTKVDKQGCIMAIGLNAKRVHQAMGILPKEEPFLHVLTTLLAQSSDVVLACTFQEHVGIELLTNSKEPVDRDSQYPSLASHFLHYLAQTCRFKPVILIKELSGEVRTTPGYIGHLPEPGGRMVRSHCCTDFRTVEMLHSLFPARGELPNAPEQQFQADTKLLTVPETVLEEFLKQHLQKGRRELTWPVILNPEQVRKLLEMVQADKRTKIISQPNVRVVSGQTAVIELGPAPATPYWSCKLTLRDAHDGRRIHIDVKSVFEATKRMMPAENRNQTPPADSWNMFLSESVPPGHSVLMAGGRTSEKAAPDRTMFLFLATPSKVITEK
jgi:beta-lactamase regulating signal transducer with metallopeptidase domain